MEARMSEVFGKVGLEYNMSGLTHRLIYFAGQQGSEKQHRLVEELFLGYFTQGKYIGDYDFLLECAKKVNLEGAAEFLQEPNNGLKEVEDELNTPSGNVRGVPFYVINGSCKVSGAQPPELFMKAFDIKSRVCHIFKLYSAAAE
ncbi:uncharacterized protein LOC129299426 [Prosopis cineraria]|uniref:uncharacterized protein LOC129299426 n=1 Tax=Prosopis cineraria TaxID=364024 RepID=UPI0024105DE1|nr:uncharacterized protein LOC129299426 [Prosopis cineraria]XP_054793871.1 uncharacterized protein LOC129299426 [Prosopis cineraria]XP_054793872.1 uncharacterized protein LOC129299426 [Prosopis cineraria]XP_054793873.1 uncharacterized protein LOC129299426 [Prosopis cineraria]XP_054793874.1 uncharacterized protein LOC129299426 [Prosopis cineraria]XP_054793875.1 uncharacterized protein LOC129299426 [Prosopis cineraria]XP_054793876.1 uncharacterized protein LOC129299426 [Prosopis cineraria]XP_0